MNILFILPDDHHGQHIMLGTAYISSLLKTHGHKVDILNFSVQRLKERTVQEKISRLRPGLVGISTLSSHLLWQTKEIARIIKKNIDVPVIVGGTAVTVSPDSFLDCRDIDMVCIGEGEYAMLELVHAMESHTDYSGIKSLWIKRCDKVIRNDVRPPVVNLDAVPFPDRSYFQGTYAHIMASRGCPFSCYYCINSKLKQLYGVEGGVRYRSPGNVISEIMELRRFSPRYLWFYDDVFPVKKEWLMEFSELYLSHKIGLPFSVNLRPEVCSEGTLEILKKTGLHEVRMGIEAGDEGVRKTKLNRKMNNDCIRNAFALAKKYRIKSRAYFMVGIPGEAKESVFKSILLNLEIKPEKTLWKIFQPYPGTVFFDECVKNGYVTERIYTKETFFPRSVISTPYLSAAIVDRLFLLACFLTKCRGGFHWLLKSPEARIYRIFNVILSILVPVVYIRNNKSLHRIISWVRLLNARASSVIKR
jgi:radical SAM superfamily enzyme YgiQ (UPF0313 family)